MRNYISQAILKFLASEWSKPFAFLVALGMAFGVLIPSLGIYQDDWLYVYNTYALGTTGLANFVYYDGAPFVLYINQILFAGLGFTPLTWHLAALVARWLTVIIFWLILRRLWPNAHRQNFFAALVFALYPFFTLQPLAFTYLHIWINYFFMGLSLYFMVRSIQEPGRFWLWTVLSLVFEAITILSVEYYAGYEFLRPVILWLVLTPSEKDLRARTIKALKLWLPYLLVLGAYIYWRFFIYVVPIKNRNQPVIIETLLHNPLLGIWMLLTNLIPDVVLVVVSSWYKLLEPDWLDFNVRINQLALVLAIISGSLAYLYLIKSPESESEGRSDSAWSKQAFWLGLAIVIFGLIPPYVGGIFLNEKNSLWNSRFGLAPMLGAALIVISLLETLVVSRQARIILLAIFVGLSAGWHLRNANGFRKAWEKEVNFFQQLAVRVPALEPNTALVAEGEVLSLMGDYPTAYAINTLYASRGEEEQGRMKAWFYGITTNFSKDYEEFVQGMTLFTRHRSMVFKGNSHEIVLFTFEPGNGQCLHVLRPQEAAIRSLSDHLRTVSSFSAVNRIQEGNGFSTFLSKELGIEPADDWCNTYQRADLARQVGNWEEVIGLWQDAQKTGLKPNDNFEYLLFLEAFLVTNQPEQALKLSALAAKSPPSMQPTVCDVWERVLDASSPSAELLAAYQQVKQVLICSGN